MKYINYICKIVSAISIIAIIFAVGLLKMGPFNKVLGNDNVLVFSGLETSSECANTSLPSTEIDSYSIYRSLLLENQKCADLLPYEKTLNFSSLDSVRINLHFLEEMRKNGQLLTSDEFASRISSYYNTLVVVLGTMYILFSFTTYISFRQSFENKFNDKVKEIDDKVSKSKNNIDRKQDDIEKNLRHNIRQELKEMLRDSKEVSSDITDALTGVVEGHFVTQEEMEKNNKIIASIEDKQKDLFSAIAEIQESVAGKETIILEDPEIEDKSKNTLEEDL